MISNVYILALLLSAVSGAQLNERDAIHDQIQSAITRLEQNPQLVSLISEFNTASGAAAQSIYKQVLTLANSIIPGAASYIADAGEITIYRNQNQNTQTQDQNNQNTQTQNQDQNTQTQTQNHNTQTQTQNQNTQTQSQNHRSSTSQVKETSAVIATSGVVESSAVSAVVSSGGAVTNSHAQGLAIAAVGLAAGLLL